MAATCADELALRHGLRFSSESLRAIAKPCLLVVVYRIRTELGRSNHPLKPLRFVPSLGHVRPRRAVRDGCRMVKAGGPVEEGKIASTTVASIQGRAKIDSQLDATGPDPRATWPRITSTSETVSDCRTLRPGPRRNSLESLSGTETR